MINKTYMFTCLFILKFAVCFAQFTGSNHIDSYLNGKVDSVVTINYSTLRGPDKLVKKNITAKTVDLFNKKSELIAEFFYLHHGEQMVKSTTLNYTYDKNGNLLHLKIQRSNGENNETTYITKGSIVSLSNGVKIKIDAKGKKIENSEYDNSGKVSYKSYYKYNINEKLIEQNIYRGNDNSLMSTDVYEYDKYGNEVKEYDKSHPTQSITYTYDAYDKMHNWIKRTMYKYGTPIGIDERQIVYHK